MAHVFISHSSEDKEFVRRVANDLRLLGHEPWVDEDQIRVGDSIPAKIAAGLARADFVVIVLTRTAVESGWVSEEWQAKYWSQIQERQVRVLPALLETCNVPEFLKNKMYADFGKSYGFGLVRLVKAIEQPLRPSPLTPDTELLNRLVNSYIESLGRAVSLPVSPAQLKLRVFVFRREGKELVCRYHWAQDPVKEQVGELRFSLSEDTAVNIAVVRAALRKSICRSPVRALPENTPGVSGDVDDDLTYVLAAPILDSDGSVWGTVDFDTSAETGTELLAKEESASAIYKFAKHLEIVLTGR